LGQHSEHAFETHTYPKTLAFVSIIIGSTLLPLLINVLTPTPQCDERPKGCLKCAEKDFICPGYDDPLDRFFQDESAAVQVKAQKSKAKAIIARDEREKKACAKAAAAVLDLNLGIPLLCPLIDQGIAYFMANHALGLERPPMQSQDYNKHLTTHGFHPLISTAMTALGLAGVANLSMDQGLKREAMKWYSNALKMTNAALTESTQVKSDNTLFATILLSIFESTSNEISLMGWVNHVQGSASLLRMRGKAQFTTPVGRRMYLQIVGMLAIKCMGGGEPIPDFVHDMNDEIVKWEDERDPVMRFYHLHIAATDFRAQVLRGQLSSLKDIVDRALEIDTAAQHIFEDVDGDWTYTVENCAPGTPGVFGDYYHIYSSLSAAQTWKWVFYNRIFLLDIIRNSLLAGLSTTPPVFVGAQYLGLLEKTTQTLYKMQADIIASIPQYMHDTPMIPTAHSSIYERPTSPPRTQSNPSPSTTSNLSTPTNSHSPKLFTSNFPHDSPFTHTSYPTNPLTAIPCDQLPLIRVSNGYSSIFALYIAGATPIASPQSQEYVIQTLERITVEFGINQAKVLAAALKIKMDLGRKGWSGIEVPRVEGAWNVVPNYMPNAAPYAE
jgi:hypothetical protein